MGPARNTQDSIRALAAKCRDAVAELRRQRHDAPAGPLLADSEVAPAVTLSTAQAGAIYRTAFIRAAGADIASAGAIIWIENDDELLVRAGEVRIVFQDGFALVGIPVFSDQSGEAEVIVSFAMGRRGAPAGLVMAAETVPRGPPPVVERWGDQLLAAAWGALLDVSVDVAAAAGVDDQHQPLIPLSLVAHDQGIDITPQARHAIDWQRDGG